MGSKEPLPEEPPQSVADRPTLPHSDDAERAIIGGLLLKGERWHEVSSTLSQSHFFHTSHRTIFAAMHRLAATGKPIDPILLADEMSRSGELEGIGGTVLLAEIMEATPGAENILKYSAVVREYAVIRQTIAHSTRLAEAALSSDRLAMSESKMALAALDFGAGGGEEPESVSDYMERIGSQRWVVDRLFTARGLSLCVGDPKSGKTTALRSLACTVAQDGRHWMGRDVNGPLNVLFVELEDHLGTAEHFRLILGADGCDRLIIQSVVPPDDMRLESLRSWIKEFHIGLVFIDTMAHWLGISEINDYGPMSQGLAPYNQLVGSLDRDCHICFIHHTNKQGGVLGSQAIAGAVDAIFAVKVTRGHRTFEVAGGRAGAQMDKTVMRYNDDNGMVTNDGSLSSQKRRDVAKEILDLLNEQGLDGMNKMEVRKFLGVNNSDLTAALRSLVQNREVETTGSGRKGDPIVYKPM